MVSAGISTGKPALSAACRATFMPTPACSTHPINTSSTSAGETLARANASRIATAPRSAADRSLSAPANDPMGVRHALTSSASMSLGKSPHLIQDDQIGAGGRLDPLHRRIRCNLAEYQPPRRDLDHCHLSDDEIDDVQTGEWQCAALEDLVTAILGGVFHRDDHFLRAGDEVHGPAHALHHFPGNHPVGQI